STDRNRVYSVQWDSREISQNYSITIKGWNLYGDSTVVIYKGTQVFKTFSNIRSVEDKGTEININLNLTAPIEPGGYSVEVKRGDWSSDRRGWYIRRPDGNMYFDNPPSYFQETVAPEGASFDVVIATDNMPNLDLNAVYVTIYKQNDRGFYPAALSFDATDSSKIIAHFTGVQPGMYNLNLDADYYGRHYGDERRDIKVDSYSSIATITRIEPWARPAGYEYFGLDFYGLNLDKLNMPEEHIDAVLLDSGNNIVATTNPSGDQELRFDIYDNGAKMFLEMKAVNPSGLPAGSYTFKVNGNSSWSDTLSWRAKEVEFVDGPMLFGWLYPHELGAGYSGFTIQARGENLDQLDTSKTIVMELKDRKTPCEYYEKVAIGSTNIHINEYDDDYIEATFTGSLPIETTGLLLTIGYEDESIITPIQGGSNIEIQAVDWKTIYDVVWDIDSVSKQYIITAKGWNLTDPAKATIYKFGEVFDTYENLQPNADGTGYTIVLKPTTIIEPGQYDVEIQIGNWSSGWRGKWIDPGMWIEYVPETIQETEEQAPNGASFDVIIAAYNMPDLDINAVNVNLYRQNYRDFYTATLSFDGSKITASFTGVQPGIYNLDMEADYYDRHYREERWDIKVDSYSSIATITRIEPWARPEGYEYFGLDFYGLNLDKLNMPEEHIDAVLLDSGNNIVATTNPSGDQELR
ncbi:MAG: hypothetical protein PHF82_07185, partial [Lutispora sp.]|nr:hypothetical protein [Lutispora sp.]